MPDTEVAKSSGMKPAVPGSQIERSRIAAVPAPQEQILPKTPRAGKSRNRVIPAVTPRAAAVKPVPDPAAREASERAKIREEAELVKVELARQQVERRAEAIEAAGQLSAVKNELSTALSHAIAIEKSQTRDRIAVIAIALVLAALALFPRLPASGPRVEAALPPPPQPASLVSEGRLEKERGPVTLARSLDRLNFVIASAGRKPQDVLLAVRASGGADRCPFIWNDGQVSLIYHSGMTMSSVTDTLSDCAEAVVLLPIDRMR